MRVTLLAVGRPRGPLAEAIADYEGRLRHYGTFTAVEVREEPYRRAGDARRVRDEEGARLLARVPAGAVLVALHETGTGWTSAELARRVGEAASDTPAGLAFAIGGAYGLADAVLGAARVQLALGPMTLTHEMARLVLTEQLYRAGTILRGEPYHKGRE